LRLAVEIAGGDVPVLAFAAVHGQLDGVTVGAMKRLVAMEKSLDVIFARLEVVEEADG